MTTQHTPMAQPCLPNRAGTGTRPTSSRLALGYVRLRRTDPSGYAEQLTGDLCAFAARTGLTVVDMYTERPHVYRRTAFGALIVALRCPTISAVIIPKPDHLSEFDGIYRAMRTLIELETRSEVVIMSHAGDAP